MINQVVSTVFYINHRLWSLALILLFFTSSAVSQMKSREQVRILLSKQNNPGYPANNFTYATLTGKKNYLYNVNAKYTLLFFYSPECEACKEYRKMLAASKVIGVATKTGALKVLAIYIDKDLSIWKKHMYEMPKTWVQGRDNNEYLFKNKIYDLHAIPTIYLLDKSKIVILKDVLDVGMIEGVLSDKM